MNVGADSSTAHSDGVQRFFKLPVPVRTREALGEAGPPVSFKNVSNQTDAGWTRCQHPLCHRTPVLIAFSRLHDRMNIREKLSARSSRARRLSIQSTVKTVPPALA